MTAITIRGDGHYERPEAMDWCEDNGVIYVFRLTGTKALAAKVEAIADTVRVVRAIDDMEALRGFAETTHVAKSWRQQRRVADRIEATRLGLDIRYEVKLAMRRRSSCPSSGISASSVAATIGPTPGAICRRRSMACISGSALTRAAICASTLAMRRSRMAIRLVISARACRSAV